MKVKIFKTREFHRWMRKTNLTNPLLCRAVQEMQQGLIDADLGGDLVKKRVPLPGRGKRGSARTLIATNKLDRWFFVLGFEKQERANIDTKELEALKAIAEDLLKLSSTQLSELVKRETLQEIDCGN